MGKSVDETLWEDRRFSGVLIRTRRGGSLVKLVREIGADPKSISHLWVADGWTAVAFELLDGKSNYPSGKVERATRRRVDPGSKTPKYAHDCFAALCETEEHCFLFLSSPYKHILRRYRPPMSLAEEASSTFVALDMTRSFDHFSDHRNLRSAGKITVATKGDPELRIVSLTGKAPLASGIWKTLRGRAQPHAIRLDTLESEEVTARMNFDAAGNIHWFQSSPEAFVKVCETLEYLRNLTLFTPVATWPLALPPKKKKEKKKEAEAA
jgi:hypothetical protein